MSCAEQIHVHAHARRAFTGVPSDEREVRDLERALDVRDLETERAVDALEQVVEGDARHHPRLERCQALRLEPDRCDEGVVVVHPDDRHVGPGSRRELGQDRREVRHDRGGPTATQDVVRSQVDRHERHLAGMLLEKRHRLLELRAVVVTAEAAGYERQRRLAAAAELHLAELRVSVARQLEELVGVALVVAGRRLPARRAPDRLEPLGKRVAERDVVGRLAGRGRARYGEQRSGEHGECDRDFESHRSTSPSDLRAIPP